MQPMTTEEDFERAEQDRATILVRDKSSGDTRHRLPCWSVTLTNFRLKVITNRGKNGSYWLLEPGDEDPAIKFARPHAVCSAATNSGSGAALRWIGDVHQAFEVWCSRQLDLESKPPDPRGVARGQIREGLRALRPSPDAVLRATFRAAALVPNSDVENVLFTNVDATGSIFSSLVGRGLEFEFIAGDPSAESPLAGLSHCSTYSGVTCSESDASWAGLPALATWSHVVVPDLGQISRAPALWWILRRAPFELVGSAVAPTRFGVDLRVEVPRGLGFNAAARVKPAIDAIVLCLSADDGQSSDEGVEAMALHAGAASTAAEVASLLRNDSSAIFGRHRLVDRRGQVAPPDDGCSRGRLVVEASRDDQWRVSARVVSLA